MFGWAHHSAGMMVSWDVHGQVSGALHRKMVGLTRSEKKQTAMMFPQVGF